MSLKSIQGFCASQLFTLPIRDEQEKSAQMRQLRLQDLAVHVAYQSANPNSILSASATKTLSLWDCRSEKVRCRLSM
jgi:hypothetical protein